jgi:membrane protein DedA with SNARE-associated domain
MTTGDIHIEKADAMRMSGDGLAEEVIKAQEVARVDDPRSRDVWYYLFIFAVIVAMLCAMMLLNAYVRFVDESSYHIDPGTASAYQIAGYVGMFLTIALLPIPDYFLIPIYGYLCALGIFDPIVTFLVCVAGAILPFAYIPARYAGRPLLLKGVSYFGISNKRIEASEKWLRENGRFAVFISTFIPFLYLPVSLAAGLLKMGWVEFLGVSALGFGIRFAFLEIVGYSGSLIFTASFDYDHRYLITVIMLIASAYVAAYVLGAFRTKKTSG